MTLKKYCEENNLDPNKVFNMVLGESSGILPEARSFTGYIAEIEDDCLDCSNDSSIQSLTEQEIKKGVRTKRSHSFCFGVVPTTTSSAGGAKKL